ncbi:hypothetical protein SAMN05192539_1013142 [Paraburkholderia diazotrophica]|uniref:Uncharacterized protein n=2 Tax=Paraburkholderia diazotrophica TaxID=667676 RepID=A0A1H7A0K1_9BURK|nr:hypothetical protein SAMN05192539_1013142 [Paraburkholderia diazotrophica]
MPTMLRRTAMLAAMVLMQTACAATMQPTMQQGDAVDLSGRLALRGNEPFIYPVVYDARGVFELEGITRERALSLQNQQVKVHGTITRVDNADTQHVQLPAVRVESLDIVPSADATSSSPAPPAR